MMIQNRFFKKQVVVLVALIKGFFQEAILKISLTPLASGSQAGSSRAKGL